MAKKKSVKTLVGLGAATLAVAGTLFWFGNQTPTYHVSRVIDGDTFETQEGLKIRLAGVDAPEIGLCGSKKSKAKLESLILKQPVHIKVLYNDPFKRLISQVYTQKLYINEEMTRTGNAFYENHEKGLEGLMKVSDKAKAEKKGIFGPECTQKINLKNPTCNIKGNVPQSQTKKYQFYYTPNCPHYTSTKVQLYLGDKWFCSEQEAKSAGFQKPKECN